MIQFTEDGLIMISKLALDKLDTGFFNLYLGSELYLSSGTEVRNMRGKKMSVLSAISQSSVYTSDDVRFIDNISGSKSGYTMDFQNTLWVEIADTSFSGNQQININIELGNLKVTNSTFTNGQGSHIVGIDSYIGLDRVTIYDSRDLVASGHGLNCLSCIDLTIKDSTFRNLTAATGSAIYISQ
jgi:hypothetical protein